MGVDVFQDVSAALASEVAGLVGISVVHLAFVVAIFENKTGHFAVNESAGHGDGLPGIQANVQLIVGPEQFRAFSALDRRLQGRQIDGRIPDCADWRCVHSLAVLSDEVIQAKAFNSGLRSDSVFCDSSGALAPAGEMKEEVCAVQHGEADPHVVALLHADGQGGRVQRQVACLADDPGGVSELRLVGLQP